MTRPVANASSRCGEPADRRGAAARRRRRRCRGRSPPSVLPGVQAAARPPRRRAKAGRARRRLPAHASTSCATTRPRAPDEPPTEDSMLLTRKTSVGADACGARSPLVASLARGIAPTRACRHGPARVPAPLRPRRRRRHRRRAAHAGAARPRPPTAPPARGAGKIEVKRTVCTHCSVGCAVDAVVENGVWVRQEPVFDSPLNLGAHCAKGAALREHGHGEYRLQVPDEAGRRQVPAHQLGPGARTRSARRCSSCRRRAARTRSSGRLVQAQQRAVVPAAQVGAASGAATTATTRRASATPPRSRASPTPGATAR